jgi:8-oxo-dGTP diphosphatase
VPTHAAGGVLWRPHAEDPSKVRIAIIHRPRYDDWTLPKGKAKAGEADEACALREVEEETGLVCDVHGEVAVTDYLDAAGRPKRVRYFAMTPRNEPDAAPHNEVDAVMWVTDGRAIDKLTYARDREIVRSRISSRRPP